MTAALAALMSTGVPHAGTRGIAGGPEQEVATLAMSPQPPQWATVGDSISRNGRVFNPARGPSAGEADASQPVDRRTTRFSVEQIHRTVRNATHTRNSGHPFSMRVSMNKFVPRMRFMLVLEMAAGETGQYEDVTEYLKIEPSTKMVAIADAEHTNADAGEGGGDSAPTTRVTDITSTDNKSIYHADRVVLELTDVSGTVRVYMRRKDRKHEGWYRFRVIPEGTNKQKSYAG